MIRPDAIIITSKDEVGQYSKFKSLMDVVWQHMLDHMATVTPGPKGHQP